jgi:hypothetical protein
VPPAVPARPVDRAARFDFEDGGSQSWAARWGTTLTTTPVEGTAWSGSRGLALDVTGSGFPAAGADRGLDGVGAGTVVTYRVRAPQGVAASISPMVLDGRWNALVLTARRLVPGWNTITFSVPPSAADGVRVLGLQVNDGSDWRGRLVLDDVTWRPVRFGFEDGTAQGWSVRWGGAASVAGQTSRAFTGTRGLAVDVTGTGWPAVGTGDGGVSDLAAGSPVTYRIWAPKGVAAGIAPMLFDRAWNATVLADRPLVPGWNTINFAIPAGTDGVRVLGFQVDDGNNWQGRLVLDAVAF